MVEIFQRFKPILNPLIYNEFAYRLFLCSTNRLWKDCNYSYLFCIISYYTNIIYCYKWSMYCFQKLPVIGIAILVIVSPISSIETGEVSAIITSSTVSVISASSSSTSSWFLSSVSINTISIVTSSSIRLTTLLVAQMWGHVAAAWTATLQVQTSKLERLEKFYLDFHKIISYLIK